MATIIQCNGDLLKSGVPLIIHQTNCMGVMGRGIAKSIREKYPEVFPPYHSLCIQMGKKLLGKAQLLKMHDGTYIANCFGQYSYGTDRVQTDYAALASALSEAASFAEMEKIVRVGLPYRIGSALAGGDWNRVYDIIVRAFKDYSGTVEIWGL